MMNNYGLGHMFFPGFGIFLQLIVFMIFIGVIYWVLKSGNIHNDTPHQILKKRLAKGEITKKEYNELLKELNK